MNINVILIAVGAFVVGLGGSTAVVVMRTPPHPATAAADSLAHAAAITDSLKAATPVEPATAAHSTEPVGADSTAPAANVPMSPQAHAGIDAQIASAGEPEGYRQVARILSSMKADDAAKIAAYLTDDQVEGILGQLGVRQSASLLTSLPTARAAALSRRIIEHGPTETK